MSDGNEPDTISVVNGEEGSLCHVETNLDTTAVDTTTFKTDGPMTAKPTCKMDMYIFASPSLVCLVVNDAAEGPEIGGNDHSKKFPGTVEPTACTKVPSYKALA